MFADIGFPNIAELAWHVRFAQCGAFPPDEQTGLVPGLDSAQDKERRRPADLRLSGSMADESVAEQPVIFHKMAPA